MIDSQYQPQEVEAKIYKFWQEKSLFKPRESKGKKSYTIAMPPPNITGALHMGHALNMTIQDILTRWKRMQGFRALWIPGIDHAGISMQNVVEKELRKENLSRFMLGREKFLAKCWQWKEQYGNIILDQIKRIGSSCDWSRTRFTMDADYTLAVQESFAHYYKKGLIYRGKRVINWCARCGTGLSDLEVEHEEEKGKLWFIKYPVSGPKKEFITVATTRPETMLGDMALAVNPKDKRYKNFIGQAAILPLANREIPIIGDNFVDKEFGTGAVKITPAHDLNDYQTGLRHKLNVFQIIDVDGKTNKNVPPQYQGLKVLQLREKILEDLRSAGLLEKTEDYIHQIPHCARCRAIIEFLPSEQWFLKMDGLAKKARDAVKSGKIHFHPKNLEKPYLIWLDNIQDWCLSRQLWWGHQMPVWQCQQNREFFVSIDKPKSCPKCKKCRPKQSKDVFDTWFSSALWPFAILGWPKTNNDLKQYYPTNTLSTARDILNLWVARMIFSSAEFTKKLPFKDVVIHATILTKDGKRMSKSLGTGIDPMALISQYGADATRLGLVWQVVDQQDIRFSEDPILAGKKFCNKIWNATRFVWQNIGEKQIDLSKLPKAITSEDRQIMAKMHGIIKETNSSLETFQFGKAIRRLYDFFWHDFCDLYIEQSKTQLQNSALKENTEKILFYVILNSIKLLHPFMPFITEELYQMLPLSSKKEALIIEEWPIYAKK